MGLAKDCRYLGQKFEAQLGETSRAGTPMATDTHHKLRVKGWSEEEGQKVSQREYLQIIGSLLYAATSCRPDLSFAVSTLAQASQDPRVIHRVAALRVLRYLLDSSDVCLTFFRE